MISCWRRSAPVAAGLLLSGSLLAAQQTDGVSVASYRDHAARLIGEALVDDHAWQRLAELTDTFGHRLAGSASLEAAIRWAAETMKNDGLENVRTEKVMVPHWVRGNESAELVEPAGGSLVMLGLGNSVGTPPEGIEAEAVVVRNFDELESLGRARVAGKIVVYNVPFTNYGETVAYRRSGATRAAALGAVGMLLRSVGQPGLRTPHTGALSYTEGVPKIPAAAIANEDAERLQRIQDRGPASWSDSGWRRRCCPTPSRPTSSESFGDASSPTKSSCSAATSTPGTSAPARPMTAAGASRRGRR